MRVITQAEWDRRKRHGYTSVIGGVRHIVTLDAESGATVLEPVTVDPRNQAWVKRRERLAAYKRDGKPLPMAHVFVTCSVCGSGPTQGVGPEGTTMPGHGTGCVSCSGSYQRGNA